MRTLKATFTILLAAICHMAFAQEGTLIAHYPLNSRPNDTTGNFGPMFLHNTPFLAGGIYCNGIYQYGPDTNWCQAETPILPASIFNKFSVGAKFKVDSISVRARPVIMGGTSHRWLGCLLMPDSTVALRYNNWYTQTSTLHYSFNTWHEMTITYDSSNTIGKLYLDGVLACSTLFTIMHGPDYDRTFGVTNFANGIAFKGFLKDLKIYSDVVVPTSVPDTSSLLPENTQLSQNYPNPFNPSTRIRFSVYGSGLVSLRVYDILGREVQTLVNEHLLSGSYEATFDARGLAGGVYLYRLQVGGFVQTRKLILLR